MLNEVKPDCLLERLIMTFKLKYFECIMQINSWCWTPLMHGKIWKQSKKGWLKTNQVDITTDDKNIIFQKFKETVAEKTIVISIKSLRVGTNGTIEQVQ